MKALSWACAIGAGWCASKYVGGSPYVACAVFLGIMAIVLAVQEKP